MRSLRRTRERCAASRRRRSRRATISWASSRNSCSNCAIDCFIRMTAGRLPALCRRGLLFGLLVDVDEAQVVLRDLVDCLLALEGAVEEALEGVPPDRAADREAGGAVARRAGAQPLLDLVVVGPAAQHHADHAVAPVTPAGVGDLLAVLLR